LKRIPVSEGMIYHIVRQRRPDLAKIIDKTGVIETAVIGLGGQGTKHAGLMQGFGTTISAGISPGKGGTRVHETIPVYDTVKECLKEHPNIVAVSIWRHYSTAKDATIEAIEAGIPMVVLITEGIPLRDVRDVIVAARKHNTLLLGGNTPGVIFPPEGIKVGMLPDVFYPEELPNEQFGPKGVTIISRSGAILYHLSDALASVGIAQNAVLGVGGDGAIGSTFRTLVPLAMSHKNTDLVVVAGEIGGCQEELLAKDIKDHPEKYPKPLVAVISGAHAPEGKTMGHAGAIVSPGQDTGTFKSKRDALTAAGVVVVNSQMDLIEAVKAKLGGKLYFKPENYYAKMRRTWDAPPQKPSWGTTITKVEPDNLIISGYALRRLVEEKGFLETVHVLVKGELPNTETFSEMNRIAVGAARSPAPKVVIAEGEDVSKTLAKMLLADAELAAYPQVGYDGPVKKTAFAMGRVARYLAHIFGAEKSLSKVKEDAQFSAVIYAALTGEKWDAPKARLLEAIVVACVDHGVTPPSAQATLIAATTRSPYEVAVAHGIGVITDVHGGAGAKAAHFFKRCIEMSKTEGVPIESALEATIQSYIDGGKRVEGLGHRVHKNDPRRDVLWKLAEEAKVSGENVAASKKVTDAFQKVRGIYLPINVDGVIGAIVADMGLDISEAKALFIYGRAAGLSAHYFEEIASQPSMRQIVFADAIYKGKPERAL